MSLDSRSRLVQAAVDDAELRARVAHLLPSRDYNMLTLNEFSKTHRRWVLPILHVLGESPVPLPPRVVEERIRAKFAAGLSEDVWDQALKNYNIRFSRLQMRIKGLLGGEPGTWCLTDAGRAFYEEHKADDATVAAYTVRSYDRAPAEGQDGSEATETVSVTHFDAYEIPILESLAERPEPKRALLASLAEKLGPQLLPGDHRLMNNGGEVWRFRASWALSTLKGTGDLENPAQGQWRITDAGRDRLKREHCDWRIEAYQKTSSARVLATSAPVTPPPTTSGHTSEPDDEAPKHDLTGALGQLEAELGENMLSLLEARLRLDLGATPDEWNWLARNIVLYGPPGTGKTRAAKLVAHALTGEHKPSADGHWGLLQFHPSYSYEDFVQGLRPDLKEAQLRYTLVRGPFLEMCKRAENSPDDWFVLVIDEINRGDPARIFGELLYGLEYRGREVQLPAGGVLAVPPNLVVIGTMNSVDRSVALVDYALRRRFAFLRLEPNPAAISARHGDMPEAKLAASMLTSFNKWLTERLDKDHALGHSFFVAPGVTLSGADAFERIWKLDVRPLLEEYFFGDADALRQARTKWKDAIASAAKDSAVVSADSDADE